MEPFKGYNSDLKAGVVIITVVALVAFGALWSVCFKLSCDDPHRGWEYVALVLFGAACGWTLGTVVSPNNQAEEKRFTGIGAAIGSFLTGYVFSKVDKVIEILLEGKVWQGDASIRLMLWTTSLLFLTMYVYILRAYLLPQKFAKQDFIAVKREDAQKGPTSEQVTNEKRGWRFWR